MKIQKKIMNWNYKNQEIQTDDANKTDQYQRKDLSKFHYLLKREQLELSQKLQEQNWFRESN